MPRDREIKIVDAAETLEGRSFFPIFTAWLKRDDRRVAAWSAFATEARWQLERACLATLADMGMSDQSIGAYFAVSADEVQRLRDRYGIVATANCPDRADAGLATAWTDCHLGTPRQTGTAG